MPPTNDRDTRLAPMDAAPDLVLRGYAALYHVPTVIAGLFREEIQRGAFAAAITRDDVRALFNHDPSRVLGRTRAGTLRLEDRPSGLHYAITLDRGITQHTDLHKSVARGDISQSSFGFVPKQERWTKAAAAGDLPTRLILAAQLFDVSPVTFPATVQTSVAAEGRGGVPYATATTDPGVSRRALDISRAFLLATPCECSRCARVAPVAEVIVRAGRRINVCIKCAAEAPAPASRRQIVTTAAEARERYRRLAK